MFFALIRHSDKRANRRSSITNMEHDAGRVNDMHAYILRLSRRSCSRRCVRVSVLARRCFFCIKSERNEGDYESASHFVRGFVDWILARQLTHPFIHSFDQPSIPSNIWWSLMKHLLIMMIEINMTLSSVVTTTTMRLYSKFGGRVSNLQHTTHVHRRISKRCQAQGGPHRPHDPDAPREIRSVTFK